jgi:Hormone-sensitive lipase (HSL) N-terminus
MTYKMESAGAELDSAIRNAVDEKYKTIDELIRMSTSNVAFYKTDKSFVGLKMHAAFLKLVEFLEKSTPVTKQIDGFAGDYDFDEKTPGNGYRSFLFIFASAVKHTEKICKYIADNRGYLLFRKSAYMK